MRGFAHRGYRIWISMVRSGDELEVTADIFEATMPHGAPGDRVSGLQTRVPLRAIAKGKAAAIEKAIAHIDSLIAKGVLPGDNLLTPEQRNRYKPAQEIRSKRK